MSMPAVLDFCLQKILQKSGSIGTYSVLLGILIVDAKTQTVLNVFQVQPVVLWSDGTHADTDLTMASRKLQEPCTEGVEAFVHGMTSEVNAADVGRMMTLQQHMCVT